MNSSLIKFAFRNIRFACILVIVVFASLQVTAQRRAGGVGYKDSGFSYILELGPIFPSNIYRIGFNAQNIFGVMASPNFFVGAGAGIDFYQTEYLVNGFAHVRWFPLKQSEYTPFVGLDAGYAIGFEDLTGGIMYCPSAGMKFMPDTRTGIFASLGYKVQYIPLGFAGTAPGIGQTNKTMAGFLIRVGIQL